MDYIIESPRKDIYIRLNQYGKPETCSRPDARKFTKAKAQNVIKNFPKVLKKFDFSIVEDTRSREAITENDSPKVLKNSNYKVPSQIQIWIDKVRQSDNLIQEATAKFSELVNALSNADKELSNVLHTIEIDKWKNDKDGYALYKKSKEILEKRRSIKDELSVVRAILDSSNLTPTELERRLIEIIENMECRVFNYRMCQ